MHGRAFFDEWGFLGLAAGAHRGIAALGRRTVPQHPCHSARQRADALAQGFSLRRRAAPTQLAPALAQSTRSVDALAAERPARDLVRSLDRSSGNRRQARADRSRVGSARLTVAFHRTEALPARAGVDERAAAA